ncbi:MAG TPA: dihydrodipicolinate synthase family protein [Dehalococcoidia bacterium]|nr:dihydrodipicolinate synthase family protein [Dehalococcoidia bacterium]
MNAPYLVVAVLTPFDSDLKVDYPALQREIDYVLETAPSATIASCGMEVQEYQYLSLEARMELVRRTAEFVGGRAPLIVGVSHPDIRTAVKLAQMAESLGAAAVQALIPLRPIGGNLTLDELVRFYETLAAETSLPLSVYHNPGPGADPPLPWIVRLCEIPQVKFFKDSSRDLRRIGMLIDQIDRRGLAHYLSTMEPMLTAFCLGASGVTMPPPGQALAARVIEAFQSGDLKRAWELQKGFQLFPNRWLHRGLAAVMKAAMRIVGVDVGEIYPPFDGLTPAEREQLATHLAVHGFIRSRVIEPSAGSI